jgi:cytoskeleton protein RodZ
MASSGIEQPGSDQTIDLSRAPVGSVLRAKREQLGWGLPDVAAWLRIRLSYLEALESGQVSKLPGNAYAIGFLRAYSGALGLDVEDMAKRFRTETKDVTRKPELTFPVPVPERGVPAGAVVLLGVVVVVFAYVGWYEFTGHLSRETHSVPAVPAPLLPYAGGIAPTASPQVATVMPGPGQTPSPQAPQTLQTSQVPQTAETGQAASAAQSSAQVATAKNGTGSAPAVSPSAETAGVPAEAPAPVRPVQIPTTTATTTASSAAAPAAAGAAPATPSGQITLNAVAASWVQVRQLGGKVLYDHILQPGESWSVPAGIDGLTLSTGNAGGLTLSADGTTSPVLGKVGGVRRGIPLSVQAIKDGSVALPAAQAATSPAGSSAIQPAGAPAEAPGAGSDSNPAANPPQLVHKTRRAAPAAPVEDETERLNRAQLKTPPPQN